MKICSSYKEALGNIRSGQTVFIHGGAATPTPLLKALAEESPRLKDIELVHLHTEGDSPFVQACHDGHFKITNLFVGANLRREMDYSQVDYLPCFLSEIPSLFTSGAKSIDVALIHVSPPDKNGYCSLGVSIDVALAAAKSAKSIIALINAKMPRVHGDGWIHESEIDFGVSCELSLPEVSCGKSTREESKIGELVASIVEEGSTLQFGIGAIPNAVAAALTSHKNLGIHTEMWSDGTLSLLTCGAVNNTKKAVHRGMTVSSFVMGSQKLYDFINDNPSVIQLGSDYVNAPNIIARNPKVVAINSAIEIDLTGQVCADSIGTSIISGVGGQMDFMRGAALSAGGKPIIALTSRTKRGVSRIVSTLKQGAGVVTTRAHVQYVVTEYGITNLFGKTLQERAKGLIQISHPNDRETLEREWNTLFRRR